MVSDKEKEQFIQGLGGIVNVAANFSNIDFTGSTEIGGDLKIPFIHLDLSDKISENKVNKFSLSKVTAKRLLAKNRWKVQEYPAKLKQENYQIYKEKIEHQYIIEGLFYADRVAINLQKDTKLNLNLDVDFGKLKGINVTPNSDNKNDSTYNISDRAQCLFAVQLIKGKDL